MLTESLNNGLKRKFRKKSYYMTKKYYYHFRYGKIIEDRQLKEELFAMNNRRW